MAKAYIDTALILNRRHISRVLHARLVGTKLRIAAAHSSEGIEAFCMAVLYLLTELSCISSVAIHDESDMVWDGSEGEEEEKKRGGDGEETVYEGGGEGLHGVRCKSVVAPGRASLSWQLANCVIRNRLQHITVTASRDVSPNCPDPARPGQTTAVRSTVRITLSQRHYNLSSHLYAMIRRRLSSGLLRATAPSRPSPAAPPARTLASAVLLTSQTNWKTETVVTLKAELKKRGLSQQGNK